MYNKRWKNEYVETEIGPIHYSRFIASYVRAGGKVCDRNFVFRSWLYSLGYLTSEDIDRIMSLASCGKTELELSARKYLKLIDTLSNEEYEKVTHCKL